MYSGTLVGEVGPSQTFTVKNSGTANLTGLAVSVTGANPGDFVVESLGTTTLVSEYRDDVYRDLHSFGWRIAECSGFDCQQ